MTGVVGHVYICITATSAVAVAVHTARRRLGSVHSANAQTIQRGKETAVVITLFSKRFKMRTALFFIVKVRVFHFVK